MERVGVLINKLQEQLTQNAGIDNMLVTTQMLQSELLLQGIPVNGSFSKKVAVIMPHAIPATLPVTSTVSGHVAMPAKQYKPMPKPEPEPVPVAEPAAEPDIPMPEPAPTPVPEPEPTHFVEERPWQRLFVDKEEKASPWTLDPVMDIPTLAHQEKTVYELNDVLTGENGNSINDKLKQETTEVAARLQDTPVKDLKKAISINDRQRFIQDLFRGDETMYERSIKTINGFNIFAEAEYWIQRELKVKLGWDTTLELVKVFDQVVRRRFS